MSQEDHWLLALQLFSTMGHPNLISYNTVISALAMANGKMKLD